MTFELNTKIEIFSFSVENRINFTIGLQFYHRGKLWTMIFINAPDKNQVFFFSLFVLF